MRSFTGEFQWLSCVRLNPGAAFLPGGLLIKGAWTEQTVEIYSWLACGAGFIDVSLCQNLAS